MADEDKIEESDKPEDGSAVEDSDAASVEAAEPEAPSIEDLLPKKFLADDPDFADRSLGRSGARNVLLPDGRGGLKSVDGRIVKIEHKGETIELIALPEHERIKRQRIINFASIFIGVIFFVLFFWLFF